MSLETHDLEELHVVRDRETGLVAVVAIHDRSRGPARGGTRLRSYPSLDAAVADAARLAKAMAAKLAIHRLPYGGGKAVILRDPTLDRARLEDQLRAYGRFLERLGGAFGTGPDFGIGPAEVAVIRQATQHVVPQAALAPANQATADGVLAALEFGLERALRTGLAGRRVAVQGVGAVGAALVRGLVARGAHVLVADTDRARAEALADELGDEVEVVDATGVLSAEVDALAPCATGEVFDEASIATLRCKVIAGAANTQLAAPESEHAQALAAKGVLFVPDYVANGGAAIVLVGTPEDVPAQIADTLRGVFDAADRGDQTPWEAAQAIASRR